MALLTEDWYKDLITIFVMLCLGAIVYLKWVYGYWNRKNVITPTVSLPFGNTSRLFMQKTSPGDEFKDLYFQTRSKGLSFCGYYLLTQPVLIVFDLELTKSIIAKDFSHFTDRVAYCNEENDPLTGTLFSLRGHKWKNIRVKLTPTFSSGKMKMMFQSLVQFSRELVRFVDGIRCNNLKDPDSEFRKYGKAVFEIGFIEILKNIIAVIAPQVLDTLKIPLVIQDVSKFFMGIVKQTVDYREKNNIIRNDFMHLLIQLKNNVKVKDKGYLGSLKSQKNGNEVGSTLTLEEIAAQAFVFFLAGFETSSTTLTFCFYELATNPVIQEKLRLEIIDVLEKHDGKLTYNAIMEMTYMDWCVNGIQHDPVYYPESEKFDPERFSPENKVKRHRYT
ncbi:hypothetical protein ILUMI_23245 [Ignelater luminosus]|uniref:Cytochrome P450 n=1 Tax=Ignelater luminosus TaxID=2038154 RepID=A0A8K0CFN6_IGNLU|nr:hypothetical protein ILUMI_23245 [Ignelater luminosus]